MEDIGGVAWERSSPRRLARKIVGSPASSITSDDRMLGDHHHHSVMRNNYPLDSCRNNHEEESMPHMRWIR
jgi:hypothetical protein